MNALPPFIVKYIPDEDTDAFEQLVLFLEENRSLFLAKLPGVAAEIAGIDGFREMLAYISLHGGKVKTIFLTRSKCVLSQKCRESLVDKFSGNESTRITVPAVRTVYAVVLDVFLQVNGYSVFSVLPRLGISERTLFSRKAERCRVIGSVSGGKSSVKALPPPKMEAVVKPFRPVERQERQGGPGVGRAKPTSVS